MAFRIKEIRIPLGVPQAAREIRLIERLLTFLGWVQFRFGPHMVHFWFNHSNARQIVVVSVKAVYSSSAPI